MFKRILLLTIALILTASLTVSCGKGEVEGFKPESFDFTLRTPTDEMGFESGYNFFVQDDGRAFRMTEGRFRMTEGVEYLI